MNCNKSNSITIRILIRRIGSLKYILNTPLSGVGIRVLYLINGCNYRKVLTGM